MSVVNLKELVDNYAHRIFKDNEKEYYRRMGKSLGWRGVAKEVDWANFKIRNSPIKYEDVSQPGKPKSHVLFRSTFVNDTDKEQDYQLRTERRTTSTLSFELFEGVVTEVSADLSFEIPIPGCVLSAGTGFRREYAMENTTTKSVEEEMTWSVESNIKIPEMSKTTAELVVQEDEYKGTFEFKTYISGEVRMKLFKDNIELVIIELGDLDEIFTKEKGFRKDADGLYHITRGKCKAHFGIEQKIELHSYPIVKQK